MDIDKLMEYLIVTDQVDEVFGLKKEEEEEDKDKDKDKREEDTKKRR